MYGHFKRQTSENLTREKTWDMAKKGKTFRGETEISSDRQHETP